MKFNFPKKTEMESVSFFIKKTTLEKIRKIAEKNECLEREVFETLVEEAIEEYDNLIDTLDGVVKLQSLPIDSKDFYNKKL